MKTKIAFGPEATEHLLKGVETLVRAVEMTLGARARGVAIASSNGREIFDRSVLDDGVKVAKSIELPNEFENMAVALLRESAQKQVSEVGDGTTATIVLAGAIVKEAYKQIAQGQSPMEIRTQLEKSASRLTRALKKLRIPVKTHEEKVQIATISSKSPDLGRMIADMFEKMGADGIITIEESKSVETKVEYQMGMQFDKGYASHYFATDEDTMKTVMENTSVLVTDLDITSFADLLPFLEKIVKENGKKPLTIIAPTFGGDALPSMIVNKQQGNFSFLAVKAPSFGEHQKEMLQDIAILTGGRFVSSDLGAEIKDLEVSDLGFAQAITCGMDFTIINGGKGEKSNIDARVSQIKRLLKSESSEFKREKLKERLAKLTKGVAVIKVGGQTEVEMKDRKERVDDAVSATRAAIRDGVVVGGEVAYLHIRHAVKNDPILSVALKQPFYQLLQNAGLDVAEVGFDIKRPPKNMGVDVVDGKIKNLIKAGIIDPLAVPRQAIVNAISVAINLIITGAIIVPIEEKKS